jgi:hypothetical protein
MVKVYGQPRIGNKLVPSDRRHWPFLVYTKPSATPAGSGPLTD